MKMKALRFRTRFDGGVNRCRRTRRNCSNSPSVGSKMSLDAERKVFMTPLRICTSGGCPYMVFHGLTQALHTSRNNRSLKPVFCELSQINSLMGFLFKQKAHGPVQLTIRTLSAAAQVCSQVTKMSVTTLWTMKYDRTSFSISAVHRSTQVTFSVHSVLHPFVQLLVPSHYCSCTVVLM